MAFRPAGSTQQNDRRIVTIGVVTMVTFLLIGVGSAAVFSRPSCRLVAPNVSTERVAYDAADMLLDPILDLFVRALADQGSVMVMDASGLDSVTRFGDGVAALGERIVTFDAQLQQATTVTFRDGIVVGSGDVVYALAQSNDTTRQVDALQPMGASGATGTCVELALVSSPLAFYRDAAHGEILLLRADEDGDDPFLEIRDPIAGRRLSVPVTLRTGSAGQHGVRTSGAVTKDSILFTQNIADDMDDDTVLWGFARSDGRERFTVSAKDVRQTAGKRGEVTLELVRFGDETVLVVGETMLLDVVADTGVLKRRAGPFVHERPLQAYPEAVRTAATNLAIVHAVTHPAGDVLLVRAASDIVLVTVTRP